MAKKAASCSSKVGGDFVELDMRGVESGVVAVDWFYTEKISMRRQSCTSKAEDSICPTVLVRQGAVSVP